jgi:ankyrin repeat protein
VGIRFPKSFAVALDKMQSGSTTYDAYSKVYKEAMERVRSQDPDSVDLATQALLILSCARGALTTQDLLFALAIEIDDISCKSLTINDIKENLPDIDDVVSVCGGLVAVDKDINIVRLVHKSTKEYFDKSKDTWFPDADNKMAHLCLIYSSILDQNANLSQKDDLPFSQYVKCNWIHHARLATEKESALLSATSTAGTDTNRHSSSINSIAHLSLTRLAMQFHQIEFAVVDPCHSRDVATVELLLDVNRYDLSTIPEKVLPAWVKFKPEYEDRYSDTWWLDTRNHYLHLRDTELLTIAVANRDIPMANLLLRKGADPNGYSSYWHTPLYIAAKNGFEDMVSLLLEQQRIDVNKECLHLGSRDNYSYSVTPFHAAVEGGHLECVKLLIAISDREFKNHKAQNCVWLAASLGHYKVLRELLKWRDIKTDQYDWYGITPLMAAVIAGHLNTVKLMLPRANRNKCSISERFYHKTHGKNPLIFAAEKGCARIVAEILKWDDIMVDFADRHGSSALLLAAKYGRLDVVKLLLPRAKRNYREPVRYEPVNLESEASWDSTSLENRNIDEVFDSNGDEAEDENCDYRQEASYTLESKSRETQKYRGCNEEEEECVTYEEIRDDHDDIIVDNGEDDKDNNENNLVMQEDGNIKTNRRAWPDLTSDIGDMYLDAADSEEYKDDHPRSGRTALLLATWFGYDKVVAEILAWEDVEVDLADHTGMTPLLAAVQKGYAECAKLLIPYSNPNQYTSAGEPAILVSVRGGDLEVVRAFLAHDDIEVDATSSETPFGGMSTPLLAAIESRSVEMVQLLTPYANVNHSEVVRPLHYAAQCGDSDIIRIILAEQDIDVKACDETGRNALHIAISCGHIGCIEELIGHDKIRCDGIDLLYKSIIDSGEKGAEILRLLRTGLRFDPNQKDSSGRILLHHACQNEISTDITDTETISDIWHTVRGSSEVVFHIPNMSELVDILLESNEAEVNLRDHMGETPVTLAIKSHQLETITAISNHLNFLPNAEDDFGNTPLLLASCNINAIKQVFEKRAPTRRWEDHTHFEETYQHIDVKILDVILSHPRTNKYHRNLAGKTCLELAVESGTASMIQSILDQTTLSTQFQDAFPGGRTLLSIAVEKNPHPCALELILAHTPVDLMNLQDNLKLSPLFYTMRAGREAITNLLLRQPGIVVHVPDDNGKMAIYYAIENCWWDSVSTIVQLQDKIAYIPDKLGRTLLMLISENKRTRPAPPEMLIRRLANGHGCNVNTRDHTGRTALCYSVLNRHTSVLEVLLKLEDIDVNTRDDTGLTPLALYLKTHAAREDYSYSYTLDFLLSHPSINVNLPDNLGRTPIFYAVQELCEEFIRKAFKMPEVDLDKKDSKGVSARMLARSKIAGDCNPELRQLLYEFSILRQK